MQLLLRLILLPILAGAVHNGDVPHYRSYFYIGGSYVPSPTNASERIHTTQMYVEKLTPIHKSSHKPSILLLHGSAQTGTNFLNTPDGRPGWASHFLGAGHTVYITDQPMQGRSPAPPSYDLLGVSAEAIMGLFTAVKRFGTWPQAKLHTQWPGAGVPGDAVFDAYYASTTPLEGNGTLQQERMKERLVQLAGERIEGEVVVVAHSQAGFWGWTLADALGRNKIKGVVALEPPGPPFEDQVVQWAPPPTRKWGLTDVKITYEPAVTVPERELLTERVGVDDVEKGTFSCLLQKEPVKKLKVLQDVPVLVVTAEASYHAGYDHCTVKYLRQAGVKADFVELAKEGLRGNGHMFFMEKNSRDIWEVVEKWIAALE